MTVLYIIFLKILLVDVTYVKFLIFVNIEKEYIYKEYYFLGWKVV
jgi:hypothetical protein